MLLAELGPGQKFVIVRIAFGGEIGKRLVDLGFVSGTKGEGRARRRPSVGPCRFALEITTSSCAATRQNSSRSSFFHRPTKGKPCRKSVCPSICDRTSSRASAKGQPVSDTTIGHSAKSRGLVIDFMCF